MGQESTSFKLCEDQAILSVIFGVFLGVFCREFYVGVLFLLEYNHDSLSQHSNPTVHFNLTGFRPCLLSRDESVVFETADAFEAFLDRQPSWADLVEEAEEAETSAEPC